MRATYTETSSSNLSDSLKDVNTWFTFEQMIKRFTARNV